jgi:hypothetical protein
MGFMSAGFDRLDVNKNGELDPKQLLQSSVTVQRVRPENLGK